jgi:hypothetical protein
MLLNLLLRQLRPLTHIGKYNVTYRNIENNSEISLKIHASVIQHGPWFRIYSFLVPQFKNGGGCKA